MVTSVQPRERGMKREKEPDNRGSENPDLVGMARWRGA